MLSEAMDICTGTVDASATVNPSFKEPNVESGMVLPFQPMTMTFNDVRYWVSAPRSTLLRARLSALNACSFSLKSREPLHDLTLKQA